MKRSAAYHREVDAADVTDELLAQPVAERNLPDWKKTGFVLKISVWY